MLFLALACSEDPSSLQGIATIPDNYAAMYVQIGDGTVNPLDPAQNPSFEELYATYMGDDVDDFRVEAHAWYADAAGWTIGDPALEGRVLFSEAGAPPGIGYRIAMSSWEEVPSEGIPVADVALTATVVDPAGLELGGQWEGWFAPAGTFLAFGTYAIQRPDETLLVPFHSAAPGTAGPSALSAVCEVEHPEIGPGLAIATATITPLPTGELNYQVRNVFTFAP